jgi:DNA (cytosine-5)-methyltransferase 1
VHKFQYEWKISDGYPAKGIKYHGSKVFSCFACGGGSTMGYKLAGYEVIGCNEIDPRMNECYVANHNPKFNFLEPIQSFRLRDDLPEELFNLDILDGSPPCSSFSMAGAREKGWGKEKKFREGQAEQVLDTLFFDFLELAKKLQPKVVIAENVKGLLQGEAREYLKMIGDGFRSAGYKFSYKLLDASEMGVPQKRERVFFYGIRNDLSNFIDFDDVFQDVPSLELGFSENKIPFSEIEETENNESDLSPLDGELWEKRQYGDIDLSFASLRERGVLSRFNAKFIYKHEVANTITGSSQCVLFHKKRKLSKLELHRSGTYPLDYDFKKAKESYLIGMSVPPVMAAQIAHRIYEQWLSKISK